MPGALVLQGRVRILGADALPYRAALIEAADRFRIDRLGDTAPGIGGGPGSGGGGGRAGGGRAAPLPRAPPPPLPILQSPPPLSHQRLGDGVEYRPAWIERL